MISTTCLNCNNTLQREQLFCSQCGQSVKIHRIGFSHLMHELLHGFTHADKGLLYTIKMLALRPGLVAREYLEGKRKKYFPPVNFYLILIGVFVFTLGFFHTIEQPNNFAESRAQVQKMPDSMAQTRERRLMKLDRAEAAMTFMTKNSNLVSLLAATPLAAFILFLFYRRHKYNYIEHLVANFYFAGFTSLIFIFVIAPLINVVANQTFYLAAIAVFLFAEMIYRSIAYYRFFDKKGFWHYVLALAASISAVGLWIIVSQLVINYYIANGLPHFFN